MLFGGEKSFLDHLVDLRILLIRCVLYLLLFSIIAFFFKHITFDYIILSPKENDFITNRILCRVGEYLSIGTLCSKSSSLNIININLPGQFMMHIYISLVVGLVISAPLLIIEIWKFIKPALYEKEQDKVKWAIFFCIVLFWFGVLFSYFILAPITISFFASYNISESVVNQISITSYVNTILSLILLTGLVFEFPVFIFYLTKLEILTPAFLRRSRKYVIVIILTIAAIITPPDVFSQLLVSIPLFILYELSIIISAKNYKKA